MSAISLFIAVLAIVGVAVYGEIARDSIVARDEQANGRAVTAQGFVHLSELTVAQLESFERALDHRVGSSHNGYWALEIDVSGAIEVSAANDPTNFIDGTALTAGQLRGIRRMPLLAGQWLDPPNSDVYPPTIVVNSIAAAQVGGVGTNLIAKSSQGMQQIAFRVVGVVDDGNRVARTYMPLASTLHFDPVSREGNHGDLYVHAPGVGLETLQEAVSVAVVDSGVVISDYSGNGNERTPTVELSRHDNGEHMGLGLDTVKLGFFAATAITLVVAIVGMANIGLASIRERQRELSVRLAVGFSRRRVFLLILGSSSVLGALVATTAILVAYLVVSGIVPGLSVFPLVNRPDFPWGSAILALIVSLSATVFGALAPAIAAARVEIATALR